MKKKGGGYTVSALSFLTFFLPSVTNIFRRTFLSNHASHPLQTWYGASARGPSRRVPNTGPPVNLLPVLRLSLFSRHNMVTWQIFIALSGGILSEY